MLDLSLLEQIQRQNLPPQNRKSHIDSLKEALPHIPVDTTGFGQLHLALGNAYLKHDQSLNPRPQWRDAKRSYNLALKNLPEVTYPRNHLSALWGCCHIDLLLEETSETLNALLRKGTDLRQRLIDEALPTQQDELTRTLPNFNELTVNLLLRQGNPIAALETAEADKNSLMSWLLGQLDSTTYDQMRYWLGNRTAIYWHLSANALTTFILTPDQTAPIILHDPNPETALTQRHILDQWCQTWDRTYTAHCDKKSDTTTSEWQTTLESQLQKLADILQVNQILPHLGDTTNLILIPHRNLHRFPLHALFSEKYTITHLPSIEVGRRLPTIEPDITSNLLTIEAPDHEGMAPLYHAAFESIALRHLYPNHTHIAPDQADLETVTNAITQPHTILHFNGHANHNGANPKISAIALTGTDELTLQTFLQNSFHRPSLVTLAACETGLTNSQTSTAEYVGWVSAFLSTGVPHVLSTLWTVESAATALFMLKFYQQLQRHHSPHVAYHHAQTWLRTLTVRKLKRLYQTALPYTSGSVRSFLKTELRKLGKMDPNVQPYAQPYYWAAFILSGKPASL